MQNRHRIVRIIVRAMGLGMVYSIFTIFHKERVMEEARVIKEHQIRFGSDFELSEDKKKILEQAQQYLDSHAGYRYLNRMRTQQFFEQKFVNKIREKEEALASADPQDKETIQKLQSHLQQLNKAYNSVLPKMPSSWDDLRDKDEEED